MPNQNSAGWEQWDHLFPNTPFAEIARQSGKTINAVQKHYRVLRDQGRINPVVRTTKSVFPDPTHSDVVDPEFEPLQPTEYVGFNIGFFDFETTDLKALMGRALVFSCADVFGNVVTFRADETRQESIIDDRELVVMARDFLEQQDIIVGWNSKLFDVPFMNARLMEHGERPLRSDLKHLDLMYYARGQFMKIGSSKLVNVQRFLSLENSKTEISWKEWQLASAGDSGAMDVVVEHCEADVLVLREVFRELKSLVRVVHR